MTLTQFFQTHRQVALGFSGGVDSAYLLYAAIQAGAAVGAYVVHSPFQPDFELQDALRLAQRLGAECQILQADPLALPQVAENPPDRCYHCKKVIFSAIAQAAGPGACLIDGTNASDDIAGRPGYRALQELGVLSPLRLCGLPKGEIRRLSQAAGLFTWDKPGHPDSHRYPHHPGFVGQDPKGGGCLVRHGLPGLPGPVFRRPGKAPAEGGADAHGPGPAGGNPDLPGPPLHRNTPRLGG